MWDKLRRRWPRLYEALEWVTFALALGAFLLALGVYLSVRAYWNQLPREFTRPCFTLELTKNETADANRFLVRRTAVVLVTIYEAANAFYDSSREGLNDRQDQVLALFSTPLAAEDRTLLPTTQKGEGTPGYSEVSATFQWMDGRPGLVDGDTASESESGVPRMEHFEINNTTRSTGNGKDDIP